MNPRRLLVLAAALAPLASQGWSAPIKSDFVFMIDGSASMANDIAAVKAGLSGFVSGLSAATVDARFAIVMFGGPTELVLDLTSSAAAADTAFGKIGIGAVAGFQQNHNLNPEAGLEATRIVLGAGAPGSLLRTNVGGAGNLAFRPDARINLILVTDEDSDLPFNAANRVAGQAGGPPGSLAGTPWQTEVDNTASAVIAKNAFVNILMNIGNGASDEQYGDPGSSVSDANFLNYNPAGTLANLIADGSGNSLEAQVLKAGLIARAFDITQVDSPDFINNFFAAKVEETVRNPPGVVPEPSTYLMMAFGALAFGYLRKKRISAAH